MRLSAWAHLFETRHITVHGHSRGAGHFLQQRIPLTVVRVGMATKQNLDVAEPESQFRHRLTDPADIPFVVAINKDVARWCSDQKGGVCVLTHVINVSDYS